MLIICCNLFVISTFGVYYFKNHFLMILIFIEFIILSIIFFIAFSTIFFSLNLFSSFILIIILLLVAGVESVLGITLLMYYYQNTQSIVDSYKIRS